MSTLGAILCGGASRRMGRDKALVEVDGVPLARRVADALWAGGCERVLAVGGDAEALRRLGLTPVPDAWPGEGPLGGLATALGAVPDGDRLVLAPCDLVHPSADAVTTLVAALDDVEAVAVRAGGRLQWLPSAWRAAPELAARVAALVDGGARRLDSVADAVTWTEVTLAIDAVADADAPTDLPAASTEGARPGGTLWYATHPEVAVDPDVPVPRWGLSAVGRRRAHDLAARAELRALTRIVSSAEAKAVETAEIAAAAHDLTVEVRPETHENDRSSTGFLPPEEFEQVADAFFGRPDESTRGWERAVDAQARIATALADLLGPGAEGDVLVVGHGAVGTLWACHLARVPIDRRWDQPHPGHLLQVDRPTGRILRRWHPF